MADGDLIPVALARIGLGLSVVPHKDKVPQATWKCWQEAIMPASEVPKYWSNGNGLGVVCGAVSGGLECLDFDIPGKTPGVKNKQPQHWKDFCEIVKAHGEMDLLRSCYIVTTPSGGIHVRYRHTGKQEGNLKLARNAAGDVLIETRGEGGFVADDPAYEPMGGSSWEKLPILTQEERDFLISAARMLSEQEPLEVYKREMQVGYSERPGDLFNKNGPRIQDMLEDEGWTYCFTDRKGRIYMRRPGKNRFWSGTITADDQVFYCFTSSAQFEPSRGYSKFSVYAVLRHHGDWHIAARAARELGYSNRTAQAMVRLEQMEQAKEHKVAIETLDDDVQVFGDDFTPVTLDYYWEPYLPKGKMVLFDADGGTGKSAFCIGLAAGLSRGVLPNGDGECEPCRTLYLHRGEDMSEELNTVYAACGGKHGSIIYYTKHFRFDPMGCDRVRALIEKYNINIVVVDAMFYYLDGLVGDGNGHLPVIPVMERLTEIYRTTGATGIHIRHTTKGVLGKADSDLGLGSVQFRNSHRGQLVAKWHADQRAHRGVVKVSDEKGSILTPRGDSIYFRRRGNEIEYLHNISDDRFAPPTTAEGANIRQWIISVIPKEGLSSEEFRQRAMARGFNIVGGQFKNLRASLTTTDRSAQTIRLKPEYQTEEGPYDVYNDS